VTLFRAGTAEGQAGLDAILADPERALIASDFDGTLSPIVTDPAAAFAAPGAANALAQLAASVGTVAIITGRRAVEAVALGGFGDVGGLIVLGHYGAERWQAGVLTAAPETDGVAAARRALPGVLAAAGADGGTRVEDKGSALAVHTRRAADPETELGRLRAPLEALASETGLALEPGRLVLELRPTGSDKGAALRSLAAERGAGAVLFCGDDLGDLAAFAAVSGLRAEGIPGCTVCSGSAESPRVAEAADLVVEGPSGVVDLLFALADAVGELPSAATAPPYRTHSSRPGTRAGGNQADYAALTRHDPWLRWAKPEN
jgi:trehalose 6-phosphate phosphatase